jgi:hypothetical protein
MTTPKDKDSSLTVDQLKAHYAYDASIGKFSRVSKVNQATSVGWLNPITGYLIIKVLGRNYMAHRLAWFYTFGVWPKMRLDHINLDNSDNRLENLREATDQENARNRGVFSNNKLGIKGISHRHGKYQCRIFDGKRFRSKMLDTLDDAIKEHDRMSKEVFGEFARTA